jgi:hypothetical protein
MAAVAAIFVWRPRPGRLQDFMAVAARAKKIQHRLGAKVRFWNAQFGGEPQAIGVVTETADWKQHGEFAAKLETDSEWLALVAEWASMREPIADLIRSQVNVELPVG